MLGKAVIRHRSSPWKGAAQFVFLACLVLCACSGFFLLEMRPASPAALVQQHRMLQALKEHRQARVEGLQGAQGASRRAPSSRQISCSRGISPTDVAKYCCEGVFSCGEGGPSISCTAVNDDYCDCPSGADEPGTSACSALGTRFRCTDGRTVPSSFVDDGICDCCNGTDEWHPVGCALPHC
eukprot:jgi/Botrbrau1/14786/Bobra.105_1s0002.1